MLTESPWALYNPDFFREGDPTKNKRITKAKDDKVYGCRLELDELLAQKREEKLLKEVWE